MIRTLPHEQQRAQQQRSDDKNKTIVAAQRHQETAADHCWAAMLLLCNIGSFTNSNSNTSNNNVKTITSIKKMDHKPGRDQHRQLWAAQLRHTSLQQQHEWEGIERQEAHGMNCPMQPQTCTPSIVTKALLYSDRHNLETTNPQEVTLPGSQGRCVTTL